MTQTQLPQATMTVKQHEELLKSINPDKVVKDNQEPLQNALLEDASNKRAQLEPLPDNTEFFFAREPITVELSTKEIITIRPAVMYDIDIFKITKSPFYEKMLDGDVAFFAEEEEKYALVYQFTHSVKDVYKAWKQGKEKFTDIIMEETAFKYQPFDFSLILNKVMEHIFHVMITKIGFEANEVVDNAAGDNAKSLIKKN